MQEWGLDPALGYFFLDILGKDHRLRQLQAELSGSVPIDAMHYPDIASPTPLLSDYGELGRSLYADILGREASVEGVVLIGYSFNGCIADKVARLRAAKGYHLGAVVIIDAPLPIKSFDLIRPRPNGGLPPRTWTKQGMLLLVEAMSLNRKVCLSILNLCRGIRPGLRKTMDRRLCQALCEGARRSRWILDMLEFQALSF